MAARWQGQVEHKRSPDQPGHQSALVVQDDVRVVGVLLPLHDNHIPDVDADVDVVPLRQATEDDQQLRTVAEPVWLVAGRPADGPE